MTDDPRWPRASAWLDRATDSSHADIAVLGVPAHRTSISPTNAHRTPRAIRDALSRFSTYSWSHDVDIDDLHARDLGDVDDPDGPEGEARVAAAIQAADADLLIALGGDNSITYSVMRGAHLDLPHSGLVTLDAHHDLRDGVSNGSPVRRLIEAGLAGHRVVQIGIADFSNSRDYAARARDLGITVVPREAVRRRPLADVMAEALAIAGSGAAGIHVDIDVDVCDRAVAPGCPAAAPGGISADELRQVAYHAGACPQVRSLDITEIDADADAPDGRTVRLGALLLLEAAAGFACREGGPSAAT